MQRRVLIEHLPELANFAVASLFFGHLLGERSFSWTLAVGSIAAWVALLGLALLFARMEDT